MKRKEDIIAYEVSGGWPIYKMTLKEILVCLGGRIEEGKIVFDADAPCMNVYPVTYNDDGMGYGVSPEYITEVSLDDNHVTIFREPEDKLREEHLKELFSETKLDKNSQQTQR